MARNFVAVVKEGERGTTPWIVFEMHEDGGFGSRCVEMRLPDGAEIGEAEDLARTINARVAKVQLKPA